MCAYALRLARELYAIVLLANVILVQSLQFYEESYSTTLNCTCTCLNASVTNSCFCAANMYISSTQKEAAALCNRGGGYLASIENSHELMLMEQLVKSQISPTQIDPYIGIDVHTLMGNNSKAVWIGLYRIGCYSNSDTKVYAWIHTCLEEIVDGPVLFQQWSDGYLSSDGRQPTVFYSISGTAHCLTGQVGFYYSTGLEWPLGSYRWDQKLAKNIGAYCRRDSNLCGLKPCKNGGTCTNVGNCFKCQCDSFHTGRACEYDIIHSSLKCNWTCLNDTVGSCFCVFNHNSYSVTPDIADKICSDDGGFLAKTENVEQLDLLERLVRRIIYPLGYNEATDLPPPYFDYQKHQAVAVGFRQNDLTVTNYSWNDHCRNSSFLWQPFAGKHYETVKFSTTKAPLGGFTGAAACFIFSTSVSLGPFDDVYCNLPLYSYIGGIACRKDKNPCGSNPCNSSQQCINLTSRSCFQCKAITTSTTSTSPTSTSTTSTTTTSTTTTSTSSTTTFDEAAFGVAATAGSDEGQFRNYLATQDDSFIRNSKPGRPDVFTARLVAINYDAQSYPEAKSGNKTMLGTSVYVQNIGQDIKNPQLFQTEVIMTLIWFDPRLSFRSTFGPNTFFALNSPKDKSSVWSPSLHFPVGSATIPKILQENSIILVTSDGLVIYSLRLLASLKCSNDLLKFPFDTQTCSFTTCTFGPVADNLNLIWTEPTPFKPHNAESIGPVQIDENVRLDQFFLQSKKFVNTTFFCGFSEKCLTIELSIKRICAATLVDVLLPSAMLAIMSWLSIFIDLSQFAGRLSMELILLLNSMKIASESRKTGLDVDYFKFIDKWLLLVQLVISTCILESIAMTCVELSKISTVSPTPIQTDVKNNLDTHFLIAVPIVFLFSVMVLFAVGA